MPTSAVVETACSAATATAAASILAIGSFFLYEWREYRENECEMCVRRVVCYDVPKECLSPEDLPVMLHHRHQLSSFHWLYTTTSVAVALYKALTMDQMPPAPD